LVEITPAAAEAAKEFLEGLAARFDARAKFADSQQGDVWRNARNQAERDARDLRDAKEIIDRAVRG
jgi:hypothetical protein